MLARNFGFGLTLLAAASLASAPAFAETLEELDIMAGATLEEGPGLVFAQDQAARGEFLEAIASLERLLALHPKSQPARLLHAALLCQIDDQQGGAVEMGKLKRKSFTEEQWAEAKTLCPLAQGE